MDEGESVREGKQQRERVTQGGPVRAPSLWSAGLSGFMWPVCDDAMWQQWRQCAGGHVLDDELIHYNHPSSPSPTPHLPSKCIRKHTHTCLCTKRRSLPTNTHTHTHTHSDSTSPRPLQHSATYIWCWREREHGRRLARAGLPPADSGGVFM